MSEQAEASPDYVAQIASILGEQEAPQEEEEVVEAQDVEEAEESEEPEAEEAQPGDDDYEEVEYEGDQYKLPKKLKEALLRQSDYTRKTQEVAEQRRLVEARQEQIKAQEQSFQQQQAFHQAVMTDLAELKAIESTVQQFESVDWNGLSDTDPVQAQKLWFQYQQTKAKSDALQKGIATKGHQFQQWQSQQQNEAIQKGIEVLKKDIPNWSQDTAKQIRDAGREYYGFTDAELKQVYDPRLVKMMHDASQYRALQKSKPEINKRVSQAPKTIQPGAQVTNKAKTATAIKDSQARLKKSGRVEDAAAVIAKIIR